MLTQTLPVLLAASVLPLPAQSAPWTEQRNQARYAIAAGHYGGRPSRVTFGVYTHIFKDEVIHRAA